jgi:PAS domain S-box-containing protein
MHIPLRLLVPAVLLLFTLALALWSLNVNGRLAISHAEAESAIRLKQTLSQMQALFEYALRRGETEWVKSAVAALGGYQNDAIGLLLDDNDTLMAATRREIQIQAPGDTQSLFNQPIAPLMAEARRSLNGITQVAPNGKSLLGVYPVFVGPAYSGMRSSRLGVLLLQHDLTLTKREAVQTVRRQVIQFVLVLSLLAVLLGIFFHSYVSDRLGQLAAMAHAVAGGDLSVRSGMSGQDEIARLAMAFDQMVELRARAEQELREYQNNLESLVAERAAKLEQANQRLQKELLEREVMEEVLNEQINERARAEQALRQSEERLRRGQLFAHIGSWEWNVRNNALFWPETMWPLFGSPPGAAEIRYEDFLAYVHPDDRPMLIKAIQACLEGRAEYDIEHRIQWRDGTVRWLHERGNVLRDAGGAPLRMLGVAQDISQRKQAELQLQEKMLELEQFNQVAVTRELRMIELKQEINALAVKLGEAPRYEVFED